MAGKVKKPRDVEIEQWPPTSWLDPIDITRTGLQTVLAGLFGSFADKREVLAALYPSDEKKLAFDWTEGRDDIWFDYICDTGDGWDPTYSIAYLVGQDQLEVEQADGKGKISLPRGAFTVLGGDQVYPVASADVYRHRLEGPFYAARTQAYYEEERRSAVYALPGNHDWYDGLTSFIRLFCQKERWVAQWSAKQSRSYFAIKLPHGWWIWGMDVQLESDLDVPQVDYFKRCAKLLEKGNRVIIVSPEPTWIEAGRNGEKGIKQSHRNMTYLEGLIYENKATIPVKIAGDLHHYARYQEDGGKRQLITCGGGGAFLHGTYGLPDRLKLPKSAQGTFKRECLAPDVSTSNWLRVPVIWKLIPCNRWFAVAVGAVYWIYSWFVQSASEALNTLPWKEKTFLDHLRASHCEGFPCSELFEAWWEVFLRDPLLFFSTLGVLGGCAAFAWSFRRISASRWKNVPLFFFGLLHGAAHIALALILMNVIAQCISENWFVHVANLLVGALPGALMVAIYLLLANILFDGHDQEVLSTQAIKDWKCFARFHVTQESATIYVVGLKTVPRKWVLADGIEKLKKTRKTFTFRRVYNVRVPTDAVRIFEPENEEDLRPRLIEGPITA